MLTGPNPHDMSRLTELVVTKCKENGQHASAEANSIAAALAEIFSVCCDANYWSSVEYNGNNAYNVNGTTGNVNNNNNKYNGNSLRPVAAFSEGFQLTVIRAFLECKMHKTSSVHYREFLFYAVQELAVLSSNFRGFVYCPTTSICFYVDYPKLREIFAAAFIDRIGQHWCTQRLIPLVEHLFVKVGDVSFNCRKGYGTQLAIATVHQNILAITNNWTKPAIVAHFDIVSFFMSLDRRLLLVMLLAFIKSNYKHNDLPHLLWLTATIITHSPSEDCDIHGNQAVRKALPRSKSLFYTGECPPLPVSIMYILHRLAPNCTDTELVCLCNWANALKLKRGMPIGNITTQIFANFYMTFFDYAMVLFCKLHGGYYERFVDDITSMLPTMYAMQQFRSFAFRFAKNIMHVEFHEDKQYIQPAEHGVTFVGSTINKYGIFPIGRTRYNLIKAVHKLELYCMELVRIRLPYIYKQMCSIIVNGDNQAAMHSYLLSIKNVKFILYDTELAMFNHYLASVNSLLGLVIHYSTYQLRSSVFSKCRFLWLLCYVRSRFASVALKRKRAYNCKLQSCSHIMYCYVKFNRKYNANQGYPGLPVPGMYDVALHAS